MRGRNCSLHELRLSSFVVVVEAGVLREDIQYLR